MLLMTFFLISSPREGFAAENTAAQETAAAEASEEETGKEDTLTEEKTAEESEEKETEAKASESEDGELKEAAEGPAAEDADGADGEDWDSLGTFRLTAYCPCAICNESWVGQPTSYGTELTPYRTIAVDRKVIPLGTHVKINLPEVGWTEFIAEDVGGAIKGKRIDICVSNHRETYEKPYNGKAEVRIFDPE